MTAIEIKSVDKVLNGNKVLDGVSIVIEKGQCCALTGENGSGKTMLLRAVAGGLRLDRGSIKVCGKEVSIGKPPASVGLLIENMEFWPDLTGREILRSLSKIKKIISIDEIDETLKAVGLDPKDKRQFKQYSLGMRKRLSIAQAVMERPDILLLDEPSSGLDAEGKELFNRILREARNAGATVLLASHISEEIDQNADRVFQMESGRLREEKR